MPGLHPTRATNTGSHPWPAGMKESGIIGRHLLPNLAGYLIVNVSLDIPGTVLAETAFSSLGLGSRRRR